MRIAYLTYWSINEGLSQSTSLPNLKCLNSIDSIDTIHYYTFEKNDITIKNKLPNKVIHFSINRRNGSNLICKIIDYQKALKLLLKNNKSRRYDLIIARSSFTGILAYLFYLFYKIPFVVESFEPHSEYQINIPNGWSKCGIRYFILNYFENLLKIKSHVLLPVSEMYKKKLISEGVSENKIILQPCCIDYSQYKFDLSIKEKTRRDLNIPNKNLVGIYVGKFGGLYYEDEAFDLFSEINKFLENDFTLIILTPNDKTYLLNQLAKRGFNIEDIKIFYVDQKSVFKYLMASDFAFNFHITSKVSNFFSPIKNGEYWSIGLPLIIPSNIGDDSKIIEQYNLGIVHDFEKKINENQINKLKKIINSHEIREKIINDTSEFRSLNIIKESYLKMLDKLRLS